MSSSKHTAESARRLALACPHIRRSVGSLLWAYGCVPKWADLSSAEAWYLVSARLHVRADSPLGMSDLAARLTGRLFLFVDTAGWKARIARRGLLQNTGRDGTAFPAVGPTERPAGVLEFNPRT
jgi:hypothetical protein